MKTIDIYFQGEGMPALDHLEVAETATFADVKALIARTHPHAAECHFFMEDHDEPLDHRTPVTEKAGKAGVKIHLARCQKVHVTVHYKAEIIRHDFGPGTTIARIKQWAAVAKFHMTEEDASNHHLQIAGTETQPDPGVHVGTLVSCPGCAIAFDLVPTPRVNGASGAR